MEQNDQALRIYLDGFEESLFLGSLSAAIMRAFWSRNSQLLTARQVHEIILFDYRSVALSTITETLRRLIGKGLMIRKQQRSVYGHIWFYQPTVKDSETFVTENVNKIISRFVELGYIDETKIESSRITD